MVTIKDILERGYFPKELPPPFATTAFAQSHGTLGVSNVSDSRCLRYSFSKYASVRRTLSIPNPAHMVSLARAVSTNWAEIVKHCAASTVSQTSPQSGIDRAITGKHDLEEIPAMRAETRTGARYLFKADVANFYGSIYTHAIPWAFHTKAVAKVDRRTKLSKHGQPPLFGNVLDEASRNIQSGQTVGLPIGPDTSFAIAESVLCSVDSLVADRLKRDVPAFRFIDDYEFACGSFGEAEQVRATLQDALAEFELQLNPRKVCIVELPDALDTAWAHELSSFALDSLKQGVQESQLLRYFSRAFELMRQNPGEPVLKYAVRRLADPNLLQASRLLQQLLFQAAAIDPGTLQTALYVAFRHQQENGDLDRVSLARALSAIIEQHAPLQHGGDVAWALWGAIVFNVNLSNQVVAALDSLMDPIAVLVALHAEQEGLLTRPLDKVAWNALVTSLELFDSRWLLVYEGPGKGWLTPPSGDPAATDSFFADARARNISFYDLSMPKTIPAPSPAGDYA